MDIDPSVCRADNVSLFVGAVRPKLREAVSTKATALFIVAIDQ